MNKSLGKILITSASVLLLASVGGNINNINVNARHVRIHHTLRYYRSHKLLKRHHNNRHYKHVVYRKRFKNHSFKKHRFHKHSRHYAYKHKKPTKKKSHVKVHKSFNIDDPKNFPEVANQIKSQTFIDINKERIAHGVQPVLHNSTTSYLANLRAQELAQNHTISHYNSNGDLAAATDAKNAGFPEPYLWGENTAEQYITELSPTGNYENNSNGRQMADSANDYMMNYDQAHNNGHRKNILRPIFKYLGVGASYDKDGTFYITEEFSSQN